MPTLAENEPNILFVSGYWVLDHHKYSDKFYLDHFKNTLNVNMPYVIYCDADSHDIIKLSRIRDDLTVYIIRNIGDFHVATFPNIKNIQLHNVHVPNRRLGMIWLEKIYMIQDCALRYPENEWYCWSDAANAYLRNNVLGNITWPAGKKYLSVDKLNCTVSEPGCIKKYNIYDGKEHIVAGTSWIIHRDMISKFADLFEKYYSILTLETNESNNFICLSDQIIWTRIHMNHPELFNFIGIGYGDILKVLCV